MEAVLSETSRKLSSGLEIFSFSLLRGDDTTESSSDSDSDDIYGSISRRVKVEFFTNEKGLKARLRYYLIKNERTSLKARSVYFLLKLISCLVYLVSLATDNPVQANCYGCGSVNASRIEYPNYAALVWVGRPLADYVMQVVVAVLCMTETVVLIAIEYKGNLLYQLVSLKVAIEAVTSLPFIVSIFNPVLINLYVPSFLNCWLAKIYLEYMLNDLQMVMERAQSNLSRQVVILFSSILCIFFTCMCGIQYLERAQEDFHKFNMWSSLWFVVVTFSTVGYGDIYPSWVPSQMFVMATIFSALLVIPLQLEKIASYWREKQKQGSSYSMRTESERHVIICATKLSADMCLDFLHEFFAHPALQVYYVVLLSPTELDGQMQMVLSVPLWSQRVMYIQGSALKDEDLMRAKAQFAHGCFLLPSRNVNDRNKVDQATILRTWAVKDFAPECPLFVQILRPENKFHVNFADQVFCEEEMKYALLSNNCVCPGVSTLLTLLVHTLKGRESRNAEQWQKDYSRSTGQEIYHIRVKGSLFFGEYAECNFSYAAYHAHKKFGVTLLGIKESATGKIMLNPGPSYVVHESDVCYYINTTKEELTAVMQSETCSPLGNTCPTNTQEGKTQNGTAGNKENYIPLLESKNRGSGNMLEVTTDSPDRRARSTGRDGRRPSCLPIIEERVPTKHIPDHDDGDEVSLADWDRDFRPSCGAYPKEYIRNYPLVSPYTGFSPPICHLLPAIEDKSLCCLNMLCPHNQKGGKLGAMGFNFPNKITIIAAEHPDFGLFTFIVPLRHYGRKRFNLKPIVLLLETSPGPQFLECIACYPMVYYLVGSLTSLDDLLRAGVNKADVVVVVDRETSKTASEEYMADAQSIVAVQTLYKLFPSLTIITELTHPANMRFMQFNARDLYGGCNTYREKKLKWKRCSMSYLFRRLFMAGNVFCCSMLDTLLYQAFVKPYIITVINLLLGTEQCITSGHLTCKTLTPKDVRDIRTYGRLFHRLFAQGGTYELPLGIYRTQNLSPDTTPHVQTLAMNSSPAMMVTPQIAIEAQLGQAASNGGRSGMGGGGASHSGAGDEFFNWEREELNKTVTQRMSQIGLNVLDYDTKQNERRSAHSYVLINPDFDHELQAGDIIYLVRPPKATTSPMPQRRSAPKLGSFRRHNSSDSGTHAHKPGSNYHRSLEKDC